MRSQPASQPARGDDAATKRGETERGERRVELEECQGRPPANYHAKGGTPTDGKVGTRRTSSPFNVGQE